MNTTTSTSSSNPGGTQRIVVGIASLLPTAPGDKATEKKAKKKPAAEAATVTAPPPGGRIRADSNKLHFTNWDANKDDFVTLEEFQSGQQNRKGLESRYKRFVKDGDGKVSRKEFVTPSAK